MSSPTFAPDTSFFSMMALGLSFEMWYEGLSAPAIANLCARYGIGISAEGAWEVAAAIHTLRVLSDMEEEGDASSKKEAATLKRKASVFRSRAVRCIAEVLKKRCVFASA